MKIVSPYRGEAGKVKGRGGNRALGEAKPFSHATTRRRDGNLKKLKAV
jgi:hypothetical protein